MKNIRNTILVSLLLFVGVVTLNPRQHVIAATSPDITNTIPIGQGSNGDIVVPTTRNESTAQALTNRARNSWSWYITRASGLTAAVLLVILMLTGIGQVTGYTFKFLEPITAWATHRALGIAFGVAVILHVGSLYFDRFVPFTIADLLVPFWSDYRPITVLGIPMGSLYVALGALSMYGVAAVVISSLLWVEKKPYLWRLIHFLSYMIIACVFVHALFLGTDLAHGFFRWLWIAFAVSVAVAVLHRLRRARTL